ncbi:50S ribosomal protein L17 [Candidatus Amesbacteria bacterium RIFOXYB1_FULL_44_23]|uniref:50S ribosomal protein L17 n=1 Tax=Candidatus Amesbacteria bacterium RIFOXYB1_FULL_44_23 TaxID=1797263 RepID=A0A1F4ZXU5_9BACT|nr:MAG: 50S ribosomal protein L17 [Candidatus Amesbacteria bacterium RIFOXYB1_FULL_44_23]
MRHNVFGKQLSRDTGQRQALLKGLAGALIRSEAIETTEAKAKASAALIEKLITKAKKAGLVNIRQIEEVIVDKSLVHKLVHEIAPRFKSRTGGYLKLIKLGTRTGDNAPMVRMELSAGEVVAVSSPEPVKETTKASPKKVVKQKKSNK